MLAQIQDQRESVFGYFSRAPVETRETPQLCNAKEADESCCWRAPLPSGFQWDHLCLQDGVLYRRSVSESGDSEYWQLVASVRFKSDIQNTVLYAHNAGLLEIRKTLARVNASSGGHSRDDRRLY